MSSADNNVLNESNTDNEFDNNDNSTSNVEGCGPILQYAETEVVESELGESEEEDDVSSNATFLNPKCPERNQHANQSPHQFHSYNFRPRDSLRRE